MIQFYRGKKQNHDVSQHGGGIYFTSDTHEIITGGIEYGKNADTSCTTQDIIIEGGPLANYVKSSFDGKISKGTSIEKILTDLFFKVKDGSVTWESRKISFNVTDPKIATASATVEVGTPIKFSITDGTINQNSATIKCYGTYGYYESDQKTYRSYTSSQPRTYSFEGSDVEKYTTIYVNDSTYTSGTDITPASETQYTCRAKTHASATFPEFEKTTIHPCNNMKTVDTDPEHSKSYYAAQEPVSDESNEVSSTVYSYYRWTILQNATGELPTNESNGHVETNSNWNFTTTKKVGSISITDSNYLIMVIPEGYTPSTCKMMGQVVDLKREYFVKPPITVDVYIGKDKTSKRTYHVFKKQNITGATETLDDITIIKTV